MLLPYTCKSNEQNRYIEANTQIILITKLKILYIYSFAKQMFGTDVKLRFRPSFFPFTEPSAEVDVTCYLCGSKGFKVNKLSSHPSLNQEITINMTVVLHLWICRCSYSMLPFLLATSFRKNNLSIHALTTPSATLHYVQFESPRIHKQ